MPEKVLFEFERKQSRTEIAAYLRDIADSLEAGGTLTLGSGAEKVRLDPPETPTLEVKAEEEGADGEERSVEFEIEWREGDEGDGELRIE